MTDSHIRMIRERMTVEAMISIYCYDQHGRSQNGSSPLGAGYELCEECEVLQDYARQRLQKCPFQEGKTTCAKCPVHCYKPNMREQIRAAMRYAGPRMLYRHPFMAVQHMIDGLRKEPIRLNKTRAAQTDGSDQAKA